MCIKTMSIKHPNTNCCNNPTCDVSLTPPFLEKATCGNCGKICSECGKVNDNNN